MILIWIVVCDIQMYSYRFWLFVMFVISLTLATYAPSVDKDMTIHYYVRSREQDEQLGLLEVCKIL